MKKNQPLIISIWLHAMLFLLAHIAPPAQPPGSRPQSIEVVYQNETQKPLSPREIVTEPDITPQEKEIRERQEKARYLSRLTKRVKEQMVARKTGQTQNLQPQSRPSKTTRNMIPGPDEAPSIERRFLQNSVGENARVGESSIGEYIPEVRVGGFTALNTDQFVFYTFYARINEQVRNRWVENVRGFVNQSAQTEINRLALKVQISQIEILLTPEGEFFNAIIHQRSDNPHLDQSAIAAFQAASPLNNPPSEMIADDGFIHLHYGFHIQFRPRYMASGSK